MGKSRTQPIRHFAALSLADRLGRVRELIEPVRRADDVEPVHQMRVAGRRLRSALAVFADVLPAKRVKKWRKPMRSLTAALGDARDADVQIAFVEDRLAELTDEQRKFAPGIQRLHLRLTQQRQRLQRRVNKTMDQLEQSPLVVEMPDELRRIIVETRPADPADGHAGFDPAAEPALLRHAREAIGARLDDLLGYEPYVEQPAMAEQLHQMRIAAKRLRYTMELFELVFGDRLAKPIKQVRKLQNDLGELHDADVWLELLPAFIEAERRRTADYFGHLRSFRRLEIGLNYLLERMHDQRRAAYQTVAERWGKLTAKDAWPKLRRVLREPIIVTAGPAGVSPLDPAPPTGPTAASADRSDARDVFTQN